MNLLQFITHIHYKLQQNAETAFFPNDHVLFEVNNALKYIYNYSPWSWTLVVDKVESNQEQDEFQMNYGIFKPYWFYLDGVEYTWTNIPFNLGITKFQSGYWFNTKGNVVKFSSKGKKVVGIYHRDAPQYSTIDSQITIDIPSDFLSALEWATLWKIHVGGFEQGAQLANYYYNMLKDELTILKQKYGFTLKPEDMKLSHLYNSKGNYLY